MTLDHDTVERESWIDRYLRSELEAEEVERFEEHYMSCSRCLEELEAEERLGSALKGVAAEDVARAVAARTEPWAQVAPMARSKREWVAAAALVLLALSAALLMRTHGGTTNRAETNVLLLELSPLRGSASGPPTHRVILGDPPRTLVLSLRLDGDLGERYRVWLRDADGRERWRGDDLEPNRSSALTLSLPHSLLRPGDYILEVEEVVGTRAGTMVARFVFRVESL